jgi:hypothetical protein
LGFAASHAILLAGGLRAPAFLRGKVIRRSRSPSCYRARLGDTSKAPAPLLRAASADGVAPDPKALPWRFPGASLALPWRVGGEAGSGESSVPSADLEPATH